MYTKEYFGGYSLLKCPSSTVPASMPYANFTTSLLRLCWGNWSETEGGIGWYTPLSNTGAIAGSQFTTPYGWTIDSTVYVARITDMASLKDPYSNKTYTLALAGDDPMLPNHVEGNKLTMNAVRADGSTVTQRNFYTNYVPAPLNNWTERLFNYSMNHGAAFLACSDNSMR